MYHVSKSAKLYTPQYAFTSPLPLLSLCDPLVVSCQIWLCCCHHCYCC